jgi:RNA polymerase sigma factor (sigma-70 family)
LPGPIEPADADLVAAAIHDPLAFAPLYRRYATPVYRYCYRHTSDPELAADLTTQIFTSAIEALPRFRYRESTIGTGSSFRGWLFTIAHNAVIDHRRRARPSRSLNDTDRDVADDEQGPEERAPCGHAHNGRPPGCAPADVDHEDGRIGSLGPGWRRRSRLVDSVALTGTREAPHRATLLPGTCSGRPCADQAQSPRTQRSRRV